MTARLCAYAPCSKPLVPRAGEKPSQLARRNCCGRSCANRKSRNSTITDLPAKKACEECGVVMAQGDKEAPSRWKNRRFCTRLCTSRNTVRVANLARLGREAARTEDLSTRVCIRDGCEQVLVRRANEKLNRFQARESCSLSCANSVRQTRSAAAKPVCARPSCKRHTKRADRRFCSRDCQAWGRRTPDSRRAHQYADETPPTQAPRVKMPKPARKRTPEPVAPLDLAALRPDPAALVPDPDVLDMDKRRRDALAMLDDDEPAERIAAKLGVSLAQVHRWDRGDR